MTITEKPLQKTGTQTNMPEQKNAKDEDVRRIVEQIRKDYANTLIELAKRSNHSSGSHWIKF
jgi:hypothetical protein